MSKIQAIFLAGLIALTLLIALLSTQAVSNRQLQKTFDENFALHARKVAGNLQEVMDNQIDVLQGVKAAYLMAIRQDISPSFAFHDYLKSAELFEEFRPLRGMAVFELLETNEVKNRFAALNRDAARNELGYPKIDSNKLSDQDEHAVITMISPVAAAAKELGADILGRERAVDLRKAIKERSPVISSPFKFFTGERAVSLFYPVYMNDQAVRPFAFLATAISLEAVLQKIEPQLAALKVEVSVREINPSSATSFDVLSNMQSQTAPITSELIQVGTKTWEVSVRPLNLRPAIIDFDLTTALAFILALMSGLMIYRRIAQETLLSDKVRERTAQIKAQQEIAERTAVTDELTGLGNRRGLQQAVSKLASSSSNGITLAIMDLDRFKQVNDTMGHLMGDELLQQFGRRLSFLQDKDTTIGRLGGDEFFVVSSKAIDDVQMEIDEIITWAKQPLLLDGRPVRFGVSAGIAHSNATVVDYTDLLREADTALYEAKGAGRSTYRLFSEEMRSKALADKELADDIWRGVAEDEFQPFFQAQYDSNSLVVTGVEVLVRWEHPEKGTLSPGYFLTLAKQIGALKHIDRRMLQLATEAIFSMEQQGMVVPKYSVNVDTERLLCESLLPTLGQLARTEAKLTLEILETEFLDEPTQELLDRIDLLRAIGIGIEVDDFGSGRSSILALKALKPDRLKIDRQLIAPIKDDPQSRSVLKSIVQMAKTLEIEVTAEGVETEEVAELASNIGIPQLQGFYFHKPCSAKKLSQLLSSVEHSSLPLESPVSTHA
jgi:diguanylate cyclase (GGDEF)-like protein